MDILQSRLEMHSRAETEALRYLRDAIESGPAEGVLAALLASRDATARREECAEIRVILRREAGAAVRAALRVEVEG